MTDKIQIILLAPNKNSNKIIKISVTSYENYLICLVFPSLISDNICKTLVVEILESFLLCSQQIKDLSNLTITQRDLLSKICINYFKKLKYCLKTEFFSNDEFSFMTRLHLNNINIQYNLDLNLNSELFAVGNQFFDDGPELINTLTFDEFYIGPLGRIN